MTLFEYVNKNIPRIRKEVKAGIVPWSVIWHWEIYAKYDVYRKSGETSMISVIRVSDEFRIKNRMVFHIIRKMEGEFEDTNNHKKPVNACSKAS